MNYKQNLTNLLSFFKQELKQDLKTEEQKLKLLSPDSALVVYHSFFILLMKRLEAKEKNKEVRRVLILAKAYHHSMILYHDQEKHQKQLESFRSFLEPAAWSVARSAAWSAEYAAWSAVALSARSAAWSVEIQEQLEDLREVL